jgi:hypothetical protein
VPHHLIDLVQPQRDLRHRALVRSGGKASTELQAQGRGALFVGGTPLYLMAFFKGLMQGPAADPALRAELEAREAQNQAACTPNCRRPIPTRRRASTATTCVASCAPSRCCASPARRSAQQNHFDRDEWQRPCRIVAMRARPRRPCTSA